MEPGAARSRVCCCEPALQRSSATMNYSSIATVTPRFHYPHRLARTRKRAGDDRNLTMQLWH